MDLSIVKGKLDVKSKSETHYENPEEFVADVRLIFLNCAKYYKVSMEYTSTHELELH